MADSRRQWLLVGVVLLLLGALVVAGWVARDRFLPLDVGKKAPTFSATTLDGRRVSLSDLRGKVVLVNIWATWCGPCRDEMPSIQRLYDTLHPEGLEIAAVSVDADPNRRDPAGHAGGDVAAFARDLHLTFPIWRDPEGNVQRLYRTTGVPESFVIARDGTIIKKVFGATEWDGPEKIALIRRLLQEQ